MRNEFRLTLRDHVGGNSIFRVISFENFDDAFNEASNSDLDYIIEEAGFEPLAYRIGEATHSN